MYTLTGIILEIQQLREKYVRIILLTREYGKITAWYYKNITGVDLGDVVHVVIERKNTLNRIKNIETKEYLMKRQWDYSSLLAFLSFIKILRFYIAENDTCTSIFDDYMMTLQKQHIRLGEDQCILLQMRVLKMLGSLNPQFFESDKILTYMYQKIDTTPLERILQAKNLKTHYRSVIHNSNIFALSSFCL